MELSKVDAHEADEVSAESLSEGKEIEKENVLADKIDSKLKNEELSIETIKVESGENLNTLIVKDECVVGTEGITDNVRSYTETSSAAVKKLLLPDEVVVGQFDCFFPGDAIANWKLVYLCIITLGLYLFVILYQWILRTCYRMRLCTPFLVEFTRGKMVITSMGRIICWSEHVIQVKQESDIWTNLCCLCKCFFGDTFAPPVSYEVKSSTRTYSASAIRQVSQYYRSKAAAVFCCVDFEAGIEISINRFNYNNSDGSDSIIASQHVTFLGGIASILSSSASRLQGLMGMTDGTILNVVSSQYDNLHSDMSVVLEDLANLQEKIISALPATKDSFVLNSGIDTGKSLCVDGKIKDITIVDDRGDIIIPFKWVPMMQGETVLCTRAEVFKLSPVDWIMSVLTFGYHYCKVVREKKFNRSAFILTNKRVIDLIIFQRAGEIPSHLADVSVQSRSFFPGKVMSGYIMSTNKTNLTTSILCEGGHLQISFTSGRESLYFAKYLQMSAARLQTVEIPQNDYVTKLSAGDVELLPLLPNETIVASFDSEKVWMPFVSESTPVGGKCLMCCNMGREKRANNLCSEGILGKGCFPWLPYCLTCALRPYQTSDDILLSANTILRYKRTGNSGLFNVNDLMQTRDDVTVTWNLLGDLVGQNFDVSSEGAETCTRRICKNYLFGKLFCPIGKSSYDLELDVTNMSFAVHGSAVNHNWNTDPTILKAIEVISQMQVLVDKQKRQEQV